MLTLIEGSNFPEGNSAIANALAHGKLDHEVKPSFGNCSPLIKSNGRVEAEGIQPCLVFVEALRQQRVLAKQASTDTTPVGQLVTA